MTENQRFWGFSKATLKSMLSSELQNGDAQVDLESTKSRTLKARLIRTTDATGQVVDFKNSVVGPVVDSSYVALSADELLNRKRTVTGKALVGYEGDAEDGDDDGKIQDNTPWERPAPARNAPDRQKKPKRGKRQERASKPKRRRLIDSLRNIGSRRQGESAQDRASRVPVNAIEGGRGPEEFPEEDAQNPDEIMAEFEQMFNDMWGEENEESPDDVIRDMEEMFDDLEQQMREDREQADREAEERRIAREEAQRDDLEDQQEPLPFEASMPADGYGPSTLSDPEDQSFVRYRLRAAQLSDDELDGLAEAPDERLKEYIRELRERSQQGMASANNIDNYSQESLAVRGFGFEPDVARSVDYSIAYYQNMIADYLDDRLSARQDIETVDKKPKPSDEGIQNVIGWLDLIEADIDKQIELAEREEAGLENDEADEGDEDYEVGIKNGQYVSGPITFSPKELTEAEKVFRDLVPEAFEDMGMFDDMAPDPADHYLDLDDPIEALVEELGYEDAKYEEKLSPPRQPTDDDRPPGVPDYLWEMYVEDQALWAEPFGDTWMRTEKMTYWLNSLIEREKQRMDADQNVNHLHQGAFDFIPSDPAADKVEWADLQKLAREIARLQSLDFKDETVGSMGAMVLAMNYRTYRSNLNKQLWDSEGQRYKGKGASFQVKPLTVNEYLEIVNERGLGTRLADAAEDPDTSDWVQDLMNIMLPDEEDGGLLGFDDPDSQKLWDEVSGQIEQDKMKKERTEKEPSDSVVQEDLSAQEDGGLFLGTLRFGDIAETEEAFDEEEAANQALLDKFGGKEKYGLDGEPEDVYIDLDDPNPDRLDSEKDSVYYSERTTPPRLPTMDDMPEELGDDYEYLWEMYLEDQEELLEEMEPGRYFRLNSFPYWFARQMDEDRKQENLSRFINHMHDRRFILKEPDRNPKKFTDDIMATMNKFERIFGEQGWPEGNPDTAALVTIASAYQTYMKRVSGSTFPDKNKNRKEIVPLTMGEFIEVVAARGLGDTLFAVDFPLKPREKPEGE